MKRKLWYRAPAREWNEALPIGNGFLGAMVFGGIQSEKLQLNEDSLWYRGPWKRTNPDAAANLAVVRKLIFEGRIREAERLSMLALAGVPEHPAHYVPLGDLVIDFEGQDEEAKDYRRELDISLALHSVSYTIGGTRFERECFASAPGKAIFLRARADKPGAISCTIYFRRERYAGTLSHPDERTLRMSSSGGGEGSVSFCALAKAIPQGGRVSALGETLIVERADSVLIMVTAASSFRHRDPEEVCGRRLEEALSQGFEKLRETHIAEYLSLFDRMDLSFGAQEPDAARPGEAELPTDERLRMFAISFQNREKARSAGQGCSPAGIEPPRVGIDPRLLELYFHYGRYLLISSSRPGSLPANLQGIWNDKFLPPWGSKFTININTEMNYWPAEKCGLPECQFPLFDHLERMLPNGRRVAREMYGCRGFVAHHNTDIWGDCDPVDRWIPSTIWPMGAAWLSLHIWEHYEYSLDIEFLEKNYPILKEASLFFLDFLVEDSKSRLVTNPSVSPENTYILPSGEKGSMCYGPAMDSQILRALFAACGKAGRILGREADFGAKLAAAAARLPETAIGNSGGLMEWPEDYDEAEPGHRHISHLFALYPGEEISVSGTPRLAGAARKTLESRLSHGGGHTGWSKAWIINLWARLHEGDIAWENAEGLLASSTLPNLFDTHPPFQIDGNFGGTAGILELLVQCVSGEILLLPALPKEIPSGTLRGVRAKGGFEIELSWAGGKLSRAQIVSKKGNECKLRTGIALRVHDIATGVELPVRKPGEGLIAFDTKEGGTYLLLP